MTVSYEQAREIVREQTEPEWAFGTFCLDDRRIVENDTLYAFEVGAREYLVGGDENYALLGNIPVVYKEDGRLGWVPSVAIATDDSIVNRPNPHPTLRA